MAITLANTVNGVDGSGGCELTIPSDIQSGDLLIAVVGTNPAGADLATPGGWSLLDKVIGQGSGLPGGTQTSAVFYRWAVSADAGTTVTFQTIGGTGPKEAGVLHVYRTDQAGKVVIIGDHAALAAQVSATDHPNPTLAGVEAGTWVVSGIHKKGPGIVNIVAPTGWTEAGSSYTSGSTNNAVVMSNMVTSETGDVDGMWETGVDSIHAATFIMALEEGLPPEAGGMVKPVLRRWNGFSWTLIG